MNYMGPVPTHSGLDPTMRQTSNTKNQCLSIFNAVRVAFSASGIDKVEMCRTLISCSAFHHDQAT